MRPPCAGSILLAAVVGLGTPLFAADHTPAIKPTPSPAPAVKVDLSGVAQLWSLASKTGLFAGLPDLILDRLFKAGVQLLSGNETSLLSKNKAEILSGNRTHLLSDNAPKILSDNKPTILSNNRMSIFSNIKVEIHITVTDSGHHNGSDNGNHSANESGNHNARDNEFSARGQVENPKGR
jgi:hypothetical protein